mgnify:CR=1 FL=1
MEKGQENPPQDQALAHRVRWADLDSVFEHMGDNASVGEASNGIHLINDREHVAVRQDHEAGIIRRTARQRPEKSKGDAPSGQAGAPFLQT